MPTGAGRADPEVAVMEALYDEHAAVLWRDVMRLTGDASRAEGVVQETLLRARQHPEVVGGAEGTVRAWLFIVARNMIIDERRSARLRHVVSSLDRSSTSERSAPDEVKGAGPAADRRRDGPTVGRRSGGDRALLLPGMDQCTDRRRSANRRRNSDFPSTLCRAGPPTHAARDGGDTMTALPPIRALIGPEHPMVPGDWRDPKTALRPFRAAVGLEYLMVAGDGVS